MQSVKDIKTRIKSVSNTATVTRAMGLISASKMQRYSVKYGKNRLYHDRVREAVGDILLHSDELEHKYLTVRRGGKHAYIVVSCDRGLSGAYNHNILHYAEKIIAEDKDASVFSIGQQGTDYFRALGYDVTEIVCGADPTIGDARNISTELVEHFRKGETDSVTLIYTAIINKALQEPSSAVLLPLRKDEFVDCATDKALGYKMNFAPDVKSVFNILVPQYILGVVYGCLIESKYSEYLERMRAMDSATKNAEELLDDLTLSYNKARQEKITTELTELSASHTDL